MGVATADLVQELSKIKARIAKKLFEYWDSVGENNRYVALRFSAVSPLIDTLEGFRDTLEGMFRRPGATSEELHGVREFLHRLNQDLDTLSYLRIMPPREGDCQVSFECLQDKEVSGHIGLLRIWELDEDEQTS